MSTTTLLFRPATLAAAMLTAVFVGGCTIHHPPNSAQERPGKVEDRSKEEARPRKVRHRTIHHPPNAPDRSK